MPWREVCPMDEKVRFMVAPLAQEESMRELCERFGISRKTGYRLRAGYLAGGVAGIAPRSRAPQVIPWAISAAKAEALVGVGRAHPSWGPKKLRARTNRARPAATERAP